MRSPLEKGSEALLAALETDAGKQIAATAAGTALKSKLTARKRRRRRVLLLVIVDIGGAVAFKQLRAKRARRCRAGRRRLSLLRLLRLP